MSALMMYAHDHHGKFPAGTNTWEALRQLYPDLILDPRLLAGISGSREEVKRRLETGGVLDSNISSWIYFSGFEWDDRGVAIIWERTAGISFNGRRASGNAVGVADGHHEQRPGERWSAVVVEHVNLRRGFRAKRATRLLVNPDEMDIAYGFWDGIRQMLETRR